MLNRKWVEDESANTQDRRMFCRRELWWRRIVVKLMMGFWRRPQEIDSLMLSLMKFIHNDSDLTTQDRAGDGVAARKQGGNRRFSDRKLRVSMIQRRRKHGRTGRVKSRPQFGEFGDNLTTQRDSATIGGLQLSRNRWSIWRIGLERKTGRYLIDRNPRRNAPNRWRKDEIGDCRPHYRDAVDDKPKTGKYLE